MFSMLKKIKKNQKSFSEVIYPGFENLLKADKKKKKSKVY